MASVVSENKKQNTETDFLPLEGTDYVEFYVGNAKQAAHFYKTAFGFQSLAYAGPETGVKDRASYVVRQNKLTRTNLVFHSFRRRSVSILYRVIPSLDWKIRWH